MVLIKGVGLEPINDEQLFAEKIASEFIDFLNGFHKMGIQTDNEVLIQLYKNYIEQLEKMESPDFEGFHNFRASSAGSCAREQVMRLKSDTKPDPREVIPQMTRWQDLGTKIGDMVQFWLLLAEKNIAFPKFRFERIGNNYPHFEEFSTKELKVTHNGHTFFINGSTDGIMIYTDSDGKEYRCLLEVKSKQTSYSRTSLFSMKEVDPKHKKQTIVYSKLFNVDYVVVLYVNASKKSWSPSIEDVRKSPDIRAFGHYVSEDMRNEIMDRFAYICECADKNILPPLELNNYTFNSYKQACAESLTNEEFMELIAETRKDIDSPKWMLTQMENALNDIAARRER